jgi:hypothetical protein
MKRRLLVLVTAVLLLFGASAIGSSVASAPAGVPGDGGGMVCNSDVSGAWGWIFNYGLGGYSWHRCTYGGLGEFGYWDSSYSAWVSTCWNCAGYYWVSHRYHWSWRGW